MKAKIRKYAMGFVLLFPWSLTLGPAVYAYGRKLADVVVHAITGGCIGH